MNNELFDAISVPNLGKQLTLLVEKELVSKENGRNPEGFFGSRANLLTFISQLF